MDLHQIKNELKNNYELIFQKLGIKYEIFGDNLYCNCPIHNNSDNPRGFSYCISKGYWKCWTRNCQHDHKSDLLGLIGGVLSKHYGSDILFKQALDWACDCLQIKINKKYNKTLNNNREENKYQDILDIVNIFGEQKQQQSSNKISLPKNPKISQYFLDRDFNKETLEYFEIYENHNIDSLKDRAIIPIYNDQGKEIVGLIARSIKEYKIPKFLIYPKGFDKKFYLYNYHRAIETAKKTSCLFIVEGQGDVWKLHEAGVKNAVSIFGKDITLEQEQKIQKMPVTKLIILTDNDQAGRESKIKIKRQFSRSHCVIFPKIYAKDIGDMNIKDINDKILCQLRGLY